MAIIFIVSIAMALYSRGRHRRACLMVQPGAGGHHRSVTVGAGGQREDGFLSSMITTSDFIGLFSKSNILALIVMAIIAGVAIGQSEQAGKRIASLLERCQYRHHEDRLDHYESRRPIGLGCYFAATMASQDSGLLLTFAPGNRPVYGCHAGLFYLRFDSLFIYRRRHAGGESILAQCG
ncbi:Sodium:dicarboxylate symporter family [Raoultella planticola]|uniref:Sodium:dicarboxylate symporter family n=1 Tax=Raoultella planticola TaxID=575 RepID=A0A485B0Q5_RAOPL|nr:Sodium:dicarboxylate symporter family [Raoultella planticola]